MNDDFNINKARNIVETMLTECQSATKKFGKFNSTHEGYAIIKEELDELWAVVKAKYAEPNEKYNALLEEATQIGAMAIRFIYDLL